MNNNSSNYEIFRDCLSSVIVERSNEQPRRLPKRKSYKKGRRNHAPASDNVTSSIAPPARINPEDLAEFVDFLASEVFTSLPSTLQTLNYTTVQQTPALLTTTYPLPLPSNLLETLTSTLPTSVPDTLTTYGLLSSDTDVPELLSPLLTDYISAVTAPPPIWSTTRTEACEICERSWIPLSYHHLIPRSVHEKVRKRGWHEEWQLNSVAWLCRACHSFVHRMASNEELAWEWFTVEKIMEREDVRAWAAWVGKIRWKKT